nr:hypothetical protein [Tanacetum cinerariifolium]
MTRNISYLSEYEPYDGGYVLFGHEGGKITVNRTNMNVAQPKITSFAKTTHSNVRRPFQGKSAVRTQSRVLRVSIADLGNKGKAGNSHNNIDDKGYWDSGYSRHMTGNISYLSEYEPYDGGNVSFGQGGGKITGKQHKASCKTKLLNFVSKPLHTLHMDLFGPTSVSSLNHKWYCLVMTDDFIRFTWTFFLRTKDDTSSILRNFITEIENIKYLKVKIIRCDNRGEFKNKEMNEFCTKKGIRREFSNARTPQQNGVTERRNKTLIEAARTMVLVNKSQNKTPYELFNSRTLAIGFLRPFGCHVMILNTLDHLGKFDAKGDEGYFVWYSLSSKAFRVFKKRTKKVEENMHVDFLVNKIIKKGAGPNWLFDIDTLTNSINYVPVVVAGISSTNISGTKDVASQDVKKDMSSLRYNALPNWLHEAHMETKNSDAPDGYNANVPESSGISNLTATSKVPSADQVEPAVSLTVESKIPTIRDFSQKETPSLGNALILSNRFEDTFGVEADLSNMETSIPVSLTPTFRIHKDHPQSQIIGPVYTPIQTRHKSNEMEEQSFIATIHQKTNPDLLQFCLFLCFLSQEEHKKIFDALKDPSWVEAMQEKLLQFKIQNVWILVDCPIGEKRIDYEEVFAPVARIEAIRPFLAYASFMAFIVYQMDVKSAFLYGTIDEEVYVMQPLGFQDSEFPDRVYKVEKAIKHKGEFLLVQVYVDDIIFGLSNLQLCREFEALMHDKFQMSVMGELTFFLSLQVLQKKDGIFLSQYKYVGNILKKFGYSDVRLANIPMDKENPWGKDRHGKDVELHLYRSMIGSLMYLTTSRPDIMFAVCACARHQVTPKEYHLHAVKRIFRYLNGHPKLGLWYLKESPFDLVAYSNSDYGGATHDRKSTTRGCQFLGRRLILWQCKKQTIMATSITEAEYVAAASGCGQVLWIQN